MPTVNLHWNEHRVLEGIGETDKRQYARFLYKVKTLGTGSISFSWREPRSTKHHRRFFAILNAIHAAQDQFDNIDSLRLWLEVGAGHCTFVPGPTGKMVALPKSIAYDRLDEMEFTEVEDGIMKFIRSDHARRFLWPHLDDGRSFEMVEILLKEFE